MRFLASISAIVGWLICSPAWGQSEPITFYVSPNGNDQSEGSRDQPFATLVRARDAARQQHANRPRQIIIRAGTYSGVSLTLWPEDSGLTIRAAPGEQVVLIGGRKLDGWVRDGEKFFAAKLPAIQGHTWDLRTLIVNGELRPRARLPRQGEKIYVTRFDAPWHDTTGGGFRGADKPELKLKLQYKEGDLTPQLDVKNAELTLYHQWDESTVRLKSHDPQTQTLQFENPSIWPPGAFGIRTYVVWNTREGMQEPGQWYFDRDQQTVVYWPKPGEDLHRLEVIAPTPEPIITISGNPISAVKAITLEGLHLIGSDVPFGGGGWAAANLRGAIEMGLAHHCTLRRLTLHGIGGQGIRLGQCNYNQIIQCELTNLGAGGISAVHGVGNQIVHNRIRGFGQSVSSAMGIRTPGGGSKQPELSRDNEVAHNEVTDGPYVGIEMDGLNNRYENNIVSRVMQQLADGAAMYGVGRNHLARGNVIRGIPSGKRAHAFYVDELGEGITIEKNLVLECDWPIQTHIVKNCTLRNNFLLSDHACKLSFPKSTDVVLDRNIIVATEGLTIENPAAVSDWNNNLVFSMNGTYTDLPDSVRKADPVFRDRKAGDFRFQPGSPAPELGIHPLDFQLAGPSTISLSQEKLTAERK